MSYRITRPHTDEPNVESIVEHRVAGNQVPANIAESCRAWLRSLAELGFVEPIWYVFVDEVNGGAGCQVVVRHESGVSLARIWCHTSADNAGDDGPTSVSCLSALDDGTFVLSTRGDEQIEVPPGVSRNAVPEASAELLWTVHRRAIAADSTRQIVRVTGEPDAQAILAEYHRSICEFYLQQGIFVATATAQLAEDADSASSETDGSDYAAILQQIEQLEHKKSSGISALVILGISFLLFFGAGVLAWNQKTLLILIPVLLFHECGHYVAMRVFGYRNLRMFFIPLFGAAVSGSHYNVAGWKKALVSLAGPVPGILLGIALGAAWLAFDHQWLLSASIMLLVVNGFNMLPFVPFDGGWVAHAVLFCRQPWLDAGFRVIAAIALIAGGIAIESRFVSVLGVVMLLGTSFAYRTARLAATFRKSGLETDPAGDRIPPAAARQIIDGLRSITAKTTSIKYLAQTTIQVYEKANAHPPGVWATLGIGVAYGASFLLACIATFGLVVMQQLGKEGNADLHAIAPRQVVMIDQVRAIKSPGFKSLTGRGHNTIIGVFPTREQAERTFSAFAQLHPIQSRTILVGQTILLDLPQDDERARTSSIRRLRLDRAGVVTTRLPYEVPFTLECVAPTDGIANRIEEEVRAYQEIRNARIPIAPWVPHEEGGAAHAAPDGRGSDGRGSDGRGSDGRGSDGRGSDAVDPGEPPLPGEQSASGSELYSAHMQIRRTERLLVFTHLVFAYPSQGLVSVIAWLQEKGCSNIFFAIETTNDRH